MTQPPAAPHGRVPTRHVLGPLTVAVLSAALWFAWMGWDTRYQVDPATQVSSGPYEPWQVVGCGLSLLGVFSGALVLGVRPWHASVALVAAFTAAWTSTAARQDDTGLYLVGAVLVVVGLSMATAVGSWIALVIRNRRR